MTASALIGEIVNALVSGLVSFGQGLATGVNSFVTALVVDSSGTTPTISIWFGVILAFAGVAICIGLTTRIFMWLENLGK